MMRLLIPALLAAAPALAHEGEVHATPSEAARHAMAAPIERTPLPFDIGGPFALLDDTGAARTQADPEGRMQLLFFGYANCPSICAVALPLMGETVDAMADAGMDVRALMITVDPSRDTVGAMSEPLAAIHPAIEGLTGDMDALQAAWSAFGVERTLVHEGPVMGEVYAHGSHIFLLDAAGEVLTLFPPILGPARAAEIVATYGAAG